MNVSLTPELDKYVHSKVKSGRYNSASEVVREALRIMQDHESTRSLHLEEVRSKIQAGVDDLDNGRYIEGTADELFQNTISRRRARLAARTKQSNGGQSIQTL